jgi:hypothetical protein
VALGVETIGRAEQERVEAKRLVEARVRVAAGAPYPESRGRGGPR